MARSKVGGNPAGKHNVHGAGGRFVPKTPPAASGENPTPAPEGSADPADKSTANTRPDPPSAAKHGVGRFFTGSLGDFIRGRD